MWDVNIGLIWVFCVWGGEKELFFVNEFLVEYVGCKRVWLCGEREFNESDNGCVGGKLLMLFCLVLKNGSCEEKGEFLNMCLRGKGIEDGEENSLLDGYMNGNIVCVVEGWIIVILGGFVGFL